MSSCPTSGGCLFVAASPGSVPEVGTTGARACRQSCGSGTRTRCTTMSPEKTARMKGERTRSCSADAVVTGPAPAEAHARTAPHGAGPAPHRSRSATPRCPFDAVRRLPGGPGRPDHLCLPTPPGWRTDNLQRAVGRPGLAVRAQGRSQSPPSALPASASAGLVPTSVGWATAPGGREAGLMGGAGFCCPRACRSCEG
jgi:hypothetical protein